MEGLLGKAQELAQAAGVKHDEGESMEQTMKEHAMEEFMEDKVEEVAGEKV